MPRRRTTWVDTHVALQLAAAGKFNIDLMGPYIADTTQRRGLTVTRTLIHMAFLTTSEGGTDGINQMACGIGVVSQESFTAGTLPDPETEDDKPVLGWLWKDIYTTRETIQGTDLVAPGYFTEVKVDIGARRMIDTGVLWMAATNTTIAGTGHAVQVSGIVRTLFLLP